MTFRTEIKAIDPADGQLKTWSGQTIEADSFEAAQNWCAENAGYLQVVGVAEPELFETVEEDVQQ